MKITISGLSGTGTSTVGKLLAETLGYTPMSGGDIFRAMAKSQGMTVYELDEYSKEHPEFDVELDKKQEEYGKENNDFIFESRIGWHFIPDAFKIKLICELDERIRRVAQREGGDMAKVKEITLAREGTYQSRYEGLYKITDWQADEHFDIILDATVLSAEDVASKILSILKEEKYVK